MTDRIGLRALALTVVAVVATTGCQATPTPPTPAAPSSHAAAAPDPTPTAASTTSVATLPPFRPTARPSGVPDEDSMARSASVERDGIRLTIRLGANPLYAGNEAVAFVTIENTGARLLRWLNDGCDTNAYLHGIATGSWRESTLDVAPGLAPYRQWLREEANVEQPIWLRFGRGFGAGRRFGGCADVGMPKELAPGRAVTQEFIWDGTAAPRLGVPPSGPAKLIASFERWTRPGPGREGDPIEVTLDSWVLNGRDESFLSPAEAIDAALADERLASWLLQQPLRTRADAIAEYDRDLGIWAVGLLMYDGEGDPILHAAFLDPVTGEVIAIREHRVEF